MARNHNHVLNELAPNIAKRPFRQYVIGGCEWNAEDYEQDVRYGQIDNQQVGGGAHLLVGHNHCKYGRFK